MKVFDGFGLTVEGELTEELVGEAKKLVSLTRSQAAARGLLAFRKYKNLPDGGYMYTVKHGDLVRVHIVNPAEPDPRPDQAVEQVPDFASGWITDGVIETFKGPNGETRTRIGEFTPTRGTQTRLKLAAGRQKSQRFAVRPPNDRSDLVSPNPRLDFSQYQRLKSSNYSGLMAKVAQAVLAFGKTGKPSAFRRTLVLDGLTPRPDDRPSPAEIEASTTGVVMRYDNRFYRTHGVIKDAENKLWLCEIGSRGVLAMRLPYWKNTTTQAFKNRLEQRDAEAFQMIEALGGFPSGEGFPTSSENLEAAIRAGLVLRLCTEAQAAQFYRLQTFSSQVGWAFNAKGTEAHNIGFEYDEQGVPYTEHWHCQFSLGTAVTSTPFQRELAVRLRGLLRSDKSPAYQAIVRSKCSFLSVSKLQSYIAQANTDPAAAFDAVDREEVTRMNGASAQWALVKRAAFYHPNKIRPPPIKFYEPLIPGLVSVDMRREGFNPNYTGVPRVMDAAMYVYFIENTLKTVNYYWDRTLRELNEVESTFEECMYVGEWERYTRNGVTGVPPGFYTRDIDAREPYAETEVTQTLRGTFEGRRGPFAGDDPSLPSRSSITRDSTFLRETTTVTKEGTRVETAVCIPENTREGVLYASSEVSVEERILVQTSRLTLGDPWSYQGWRTFGRFEGGVFLGGWRMPQFAIDECGESTVRTAYDELYAPGPCTDIVDQGPWLVRCERVVPAPSVPLPPMPPATETRAQHKGVLKVWADFPPFGRATEIHTQTAQGDPIMPWELWFTRTPNDFGDYQQARGTYNCLGGGEIVVTAAGPNNIGGLVIRGTPFDPRFRERFPCFVGVVNGDGNL